MPGAVLRYGHGNSEISLGFLDRPQETQRFLVNGRTMAYATAQWHSIAPARTWPEGDSELWVDRYEHEAVDAMRCFLKVVHGDTRGTAPDSLSPRLLAHVVTYAMYYGAERAMQTRIETWLSSLEAIVLNLSRLRDWPLLVYAAKTMAPHIRLRNLERRIQTELPRDDIDEILSGDGEFHRIPSNMVWTVRDVLSRIRDKRLQTIDNLLQVLRGPMSDMRERHQRLLDDGRRLSTHEHQHAQMLDVWKAALEDASMWPLPRSSAVKGSIQALADAILKVRGPTRSVAGCEHIFTTEDLQKEVTNLLTRVSTGFD